MICLLPAAKNSWLMTLGAAFEIKGEVKTTGEILNEQLAQSIAHLLGYEFIADHPIAKAVTSQAFV
ncbi:MAG: hypothetical protein WDM90_22845 [Ferruginibacter sp.]